MKLIELYELSNLLATSLDQTLPARAAFSIARFFTEAEKDLSLYTKTREQLILKYSEESNYEEDSTLNFKIPAEKLESFEKEMADLDNIEVDTQLKLHYEDLESLSLTPREVVKLLPYIE